MPQGHCRLHNGGALAPRKSRQASRGSTNRRLRLFWTVSLQHPPGDAHCAPPRGHYAHDRRYFADHVAAAESRGRADDVTRWLPHFRFRDLLGDNVETLPASESGKT